jgi:hypothetical protein
VTDVREGGGSEEGNVDDDHSNKSLGRTHVPQDCCDWYSDSISASGSEAWRNVPESRACVDRDRFSQTQGRQNLRVPGEADVPQFGFGRRLDFLLRVLEYEKPVCMCVGVYIHICERIKVVLRSRLVNVVASGQASRQRIVRCDTTHERMRSPPKAQIPFLRYGKATHMTGACARDPIRVQSVPKWKESRHLRPTEDELPAVCASRGVGDACSLLQTA